MFLGFCEFAAFAYGVPVFDDQHTQISGITPLVLQNLPQNSPITWTVACLYSLVVIFTYPLQIAPANNVLESYITAGMPKSRKRQCIKNISRTFVVFVSCLITVAMYEYISELLEIVASISAIPMAFTLPPMFHLKVCADTMCKKAIDWIFIAFSVGIAIFCTYNGVVAFMKKLDEA